MNQFGVGLLLALVISGAAYATRSLSRSGALTAVIIGASVYGGGGWAAALVLLAFFAGSSVIEIVLKPFAHRPAGRYAKGGRRDAGQVLANGLIPAACMLLAATMPGAKWTWTAFAGSVAAANADTWATELGALSRASPRLVTNLARRVRRGASGAVSVEGTLAAAVGAGLIGALVVAVAPERSTAGLLTIITAGFCGALLDSVLGATVQAMYTCTSEDTETEQYPIHSCGSRTIHTRGWPWLNNDGVNLLCSAAGALLATTLAAAI